MRQLITVLIPVFLLAHRAPCQSGKQPAPSLIVLINVDQFRGDYIDRFGPQLHGGLARLSRGAWFINAHHDHALTETAPGHATLLSGRFPRSTGIIANWSGVEDSTTPLVGAPKGVGASPRRFQGTTLVDWLRSRDSQSRALSVSMKDRAAILPIGRSHSEVYWYYPDGRFTTSTYYRDTLPDWVNAFNARHEPQSFAGKSWTLLLPDSAYHEPDSVRVEMGGHDVVFPHVLPADGDQAANQIRRSPWMDAVTLDFALAGVNVLGLGKGPHTDVLAISLSATDVIGHSYGPDSREMHDNILRLDRNLGVFLDSLFRLRDSTRIAIALSGDHGSGTIPELVPKSVRPAPTRVNAAALANGLTGIAALANLDTTLIGLDGHMVIVDPSLAKSRRAGVDSVLTVFATQVRSLPGIARVDRFRDLLRGDTINDPVARRWIHQLPANGNVEMVITLTPLSIFGGIVATHGSPYNYDSNVPLIFSGLWFAPGRYSEFVRTVDLAPTLAAVAGVAPGEKIDGVVLRQALKQR
ncbi:MAG TPA: alkaline phosphatase family protein [Gemmatimonadaceae bacterium]|nr:alkaline phosphatase family protein [Gemmatimonadaceae bacterium]